MFVCFGFKFSVKLDSFEAISVLLYYLPKNILLSLANLIQKLLIMYLSGTRAYSFLINYPKNENFYGIESRILFFLWITFICDFHIPTRQNWIFSSSGANVIKLFTLGKSMLALPVMFRFPLCYVRVLPAGGGGGGRKWKAENWWCSAENVYVDLPWPLFTAVIYKF